MYMCDMCVCTFFYASSCILCVTMCKWKSAHVRFRSLHACIDTSVCISLVCQLCVLPCTGMGLRLLSAQNSKNFEFLPTE